jgi:RNA-splicing ligase RtcB
LKIFGQHDIATISQMQRCIAAGGARGGGCDEAPQVYRRLNEVVAAHAGTIRVLHTLGPIGVAMAGEHTRDPYKD